MIFITVGTQLPFDRLIKYVDDWAEYAPNTEIFAQIGASNYVPKNIQFKHHLTISEFDNLFTKAGLIISHAGMGTIISALLAEKPIVMMPRDASLGEHRNQHQQATSKRFSKTNGCTSCLGEKDLIETLNNRELLSSGVANNKNISFCAELTKRWGRVI